MPNWNNIILEIFILPPVRKLNKTNTFILNQKRNNPPALLCETQMKNKSKFFASAKKTKTRKNCLFD